MNSPYRLLTSIIASICMMGNPIALADSADTASTLRPDISDQAKLFSPLQIEQLRNAIEHARKEGNIVATVVAETTMLRLTLLQRANELNEEYRHQWVLSFPDQPLAEEIDLASSVGPIRPTEMQPLPLTFYFARASGEGSKLIAIGGLDVLRSEIGTPETNAISLEAGLHYSNIITTDDDPGRAFTEMVEIFLNDVTTRRSEIYRHDKPGSKSDFSALILIASGLVFAIAIALVLRKLSGKGRSSIVETTLPKLPLNTRLGGRHSGGMTAEIDWDTYEETPPKEDARQ